MFLRPDLPSGFVSLLSYMELVFRPRDGVGVVSGARCTDSLTEVFKVRVSVSVGGLAFRTALRAIVSSPGTIVLFLIV